MNVHAADSLPRAVLIDLGDTIVDILSRDRKRGLSAVLEFAVDIPAAGPRRDELISRLAEYGEELDDRFEALCSRHNLEYRQLDFHRLLYGRFGVEFTIDEDRLEWEYWKASLELAPAPGLEAAIAVCAARGIRMAVISNTTYRGFVLRKEFERLGVMRYFDFVMASADYGIRKPDPLLFDIALRRMGVKPEEAWHIGNAVPIDCAGAAAAGMVPVWYAADDICRGRYEAESAGLPAGALTIREWAELEGILKGLERVEG
jgi:putative hydrolase of the HAD superfamily